MAKKHLTKNEILARVKKVRDLKNHADKALFTGMATLCNYVLWKDEGWYQKKLADYNQRVAEYDRQLDSEEISLEIISNRLMEKAGFTVEYVPYTYDGIAVSKKSGFLYEMEKEIVDSDNNINALSVRYTLIHYQVLMDMGYGEKRLNRNRDFVNARLARINVEDGSRFADLHRELLDGAGIYIEMPKRG